MQLNIGLSMEEREAHVAHIEGCRLTQGLSRLEDRECP